MINLQKIVKLLTDALGDSAYFGKASSAQVTAGTNDSVSITPLGLAGSEYKINRYTSPAQTISSGGSISLAHGLGTDNLDVDFYLKCIVADGAYPVGRVLKVSLNSSNAGSSDNRYNALHWDDTNVYFNFYGASSIFATGNLSGGNVFLNNSSWQLYITAETRP